MTIRRDETSPIILLGFHAQIDEGYPADDGDDTAYYDVGPCLYDAALEDPFEFYAISGGMTHDEALARCLELCERHLLDIGKHIRLH